MNSTAQDYLTKSLDELIAEDKGSKGLGGINFTHSLIFVCRGPQNEVKV